MRVPERPPAKQKCLLSEHPRARPIPPPELLPSAIGQAGFPDLAHAYVEAYPNHEAPAWRRLPVDGPLGFRLENFSGNARAPLSSWQGAKYSVIPHWLKSL